jgi:hypothetical protein
MRPVPFKKFFDLHGALSPSFLSQVKKNRIMKDTRIAFCNHPEKKRTLQIAITKIPLPETKGRGI